MRLTHTDHMAQEQVHEKAVELKLNSETEAEMQIKWMLRRERFNETGEHTHECAGCGAMIVCYSAECVTDRAYIGEALSEAACDGAHARIR